MSRPEGPKMPCGWGCKAQLTVTQMRKHFSECPNRPGEKGQRDAMIAAQKEWAGKEPK